MANKNQLHQQFLNPGMEEMPSTADLMYVLVGCHTFKKYRSLCISHICLVYYYFQWKLVIRDVFAAFPFSILLQKMYSSGRHPMVCYAYYIYSNVQITG